MDSNEPKISPEALKNLQDIYKKINNNEVIDEETLYAVKSIELASKVINTIMSGAQIDPIFFKKLFDDIEKKINKEKKVPQKIIKKKKFNYKSKADI